MVPIPHKWFVILNISSRFIQSFHLSTCKSLSPNETFSNVNIWLQNTRSRTAKMTDSVWNRLKYDTVVSSCLQLPFSQVKDKQQRQADNPLQPWTSLITTPVLRNCQNSSQRCLIGGYTIQSFLTDRTDILNYDLMVVLWPKDVSPSRQRHVRRRKLKKETPFSKNDTVDVVKMTSLFIPKDCSEIRQPTDNVSKDGRKPEIQQETHSDSQVFHFQHGKRTTHI